MKDIILKQIDNLIQLRSNYISIVVVVIGGCAGLILSTLNLIKIIFILLGISIIIIFMANIERCNIQIKKNMEDIKCLL